MPGFGIRQCQECGKNVPLKTRRDVVRKNFCSRACACKYAGERMRAALIGRKRSEESIRKQSESLKRTLAVSHPMRGRKHSKETLERISKSQKARLLNNPNPKGDAHPLWKGEERKRSDRRNRYKTDLSFRLSLRLRSRLNSAIRGKAKTGSAVRDLGCSIEDLKKHLESQFHDGMSWDNYGKWHVDHVIPMSAFDLTDREQLLKCCNFTNLQPLWASENSKKGSRTDYAQKFARS